jgi:hypothetical protein
MCFKWLKVLLWENSWHGFGGSWGFWESTKCVAIFIFRSDDSEAGKEELRICQAAETVTNKSDIQFEQGMGME